jgi:cyclophilin family peptidyl-prolyl cis-trans isomerase/HEAT repeat protein
MESSSACRITFANHWSLPLRKVAAVVALVMSASFANAQSVPRAPSPDEVTLYARLMSMTDSRTLDRAIVDSALASSWAPLRAASALAVGQIGAAHGLPGVSLLTELLSDPDSKVASNAAYALGLLHDSSSVSSLSSALDGRAVVAREAAWALGEIGAPARAAILAGLKKTRADEGRMIQLLLAAAKLRPVPVAELRPYLAMSARPSVQWAASYAIARPRAAAGVRDLIALSVTPEFQRFTAATANAGTIAPYIVPSVGVQRARAEIARALSKQAAGDSLGEQAVPVLLKLATDPHPHVRINAVRSLGTYGARGRDAVIAATKDADANVRITAAQSLGTVLDSVTTAWTPLWASDTSLMYRSSLLASAAHAGAYLPALAEWTTNKDWRYRAAALNAVGASTDKERVTRAAYAMLRDPDGRVRANAYGQLVGNDTAAPPIAVHNALITGLSDADFYARATAISVLSGHPNGADGSRVLTSYSRALADSGNDARIAAIQYLAAAWKADSTGFSPELKRQVTSLKPSDDPLVRAGADSVSIFATWPSTSGNPKPLSWYQDIVRTYVVPALGGQTQRATITTRRGAIVLELFGAEAPITVWNFMNLARTGYYRGTGFHRVVPNFVAQDGDPRDDGNGGPGYAIRDEMNPHRYERGALGMALSGPDTGGSQYFITHSPQPHLDGHYTVFGRVVSGFPALDAVVQGDRILSIVGR